MEDHRSSSRIPFKRPVSFDSVKAVEVDGAVEPLKGGCMGCDLSRSGLRSKFNRFVPLNTSLILNFDVDPKNSVEIEGKVVWVQKVPHGENYHIGLKFVDSDLNFQSKDALQKYFERQ